MPEFSFLGELTF